MPIQYEVCHLCNNPGEFQCTNCNQPTCGNDVHVRVVCTKCIHPQKSEYTVQQASCDDVEVLEELVKLFWGDPIQLMFSQTYRVAQEPAMTAKKDGNIIGFISYNDFGKNAVLIMALGILPGFQGCGIGRTLVEQIENYAKSQGKQQLLVVTSNDNLPAFAFYQRQGFQLFEVSPNVIAEKLGGLKPGFARIPIRDELRLRKILI
ncbi:MAG: GNAT family N-acetyltransferase [Candidatus Hermodarchaeota archaeon]